MSTDLERSLQSWLADEAPRHEPAGLADTVLAKVAKTRRLPGWLLLERWLPMETSARMGPQVRAAIVVAALVLLTAVSVGLMALASQPPLPAPYGLAGNGLIAFENGGDIWVAREDGSGRRPLTRTDDWVEADPVWSRDGRRLAFWATAREQADEATAPADLVVIDVDGEDRRVAASEVPFPSSISWGPDGDVVAYSSGLPGITETRIFLVPTDGSGPRQIGDPETDAWSPVISPDGSTIAFRAGNHDAERGLFLIDRDGSDLRRLSQSTGGEYSIDWSLEWSPDGRYLAAGLGAGSEIRVFQVARLREVPIADHPRLRGRPHVSSEAAWSPNGERLAYISKTDAIRIVISDPEGRDSSLVEGVELDAGSTLEWSNLEWSPDGSRLLGFARLESDEWPGRRGIVVIDPSHEQRPVFIPADASGAWQRIAP